MGTRLGAFMVACSPDERGCWVWKRALTHNGYGRFRFKGRTLRAHRWAWEFFRGSIPEGVLVCHSCDNPRCVNPDHLFLGTQKENIADRDAKGRGIDGAKNGKNKLTPAQVSRIRAFQPQRYGDLSRLARAYGVTPQNVRNIRLGRIWRHVA